MNKLTQEQIDSFDKMISYYKKANLADNDNINKIDELVDLINNVLQKNGIPESINKTHIKFSADYIGNVFKVDDKKLTNIIFDSIYPKPTQKYYSHYTTFDGAYNIIEKKELWLFNLIKNFKDDEFRLFYEEHNIKGYREFKSTFGVKTDYKSIMSELFSLSLTDYKNDSPSLWKYFGYNGTGIKLTFEIESKTPDFREVYYSDKQNPKQIDILSDLFNSTINKYNKPLCFSEISKIGAFYISGNFNNEKEYRFLVNRNSDNYNAWDFKPVIYRDEISYISVPFKSKLADFKLIKVSKGPNCSISNFESIKKMIKNNYTETIEFEE